MRRTAKPCHQPVCTPVYRNELVQDSSHLKSSPVKRSRREAPRSERLVHEHRVVLGRRQRTFRFVGQDGHLVAGQRRADEVAAGAVGAVDGQQPAVGVRRHADVVLEYQTQLGVGVVTRTPRVDPLSQDARRTILYHTQHARTPC